jgi:hypothetical protein
LLDLKREDVDFDHNLIHVRRLVVNQHIGPPKTEASQKPIPTDPELENSLWLWKQERRERSENAKKDKYLSFNSAFLLLHSSFCILTFYFCIQSMVLVDQAWRAVNELPNG